MGPVTDAHKLTYKENIALAIQQTKSRFTDGFTYQGELSGRKANILELIGATAAIVDGPRGGDTPNIDAQIEPVWVTPRQIEWGKLIEKEDQIKALTDYKSPFVQNAAAAIVRGRDAIFAAALFGTRIIGQDGNINSAWVGQTVANTVGSAGGATDTGMNVAKILRAKRFLQTPYIDIDQEKIILAMNAQGIEELYNDITYVNTQYRGEGKVVLDGKQVREIADVTIVQYESLTDIDATHYGFAMWCMSGMHYGDFEPLTITVEPNPQKKYRMHPYMENWWGTTRSEDAKCVKISSKK